jgi:D-glycero-beta-D-manno-heptose-7-phosphate kinase
MTINALQTVVSRFPGKRALILGDIILDEYLLGKANRISPEAPVPVVEICTSNYVPGGAANVAANVSDLDGKAFVGGVVGSDWQAELVLKTLDSRGVCHEGIFPDSTRPTTTKTRLIAHNHQIVRMDRESRSAISAALEDQISVWIDMHLPKVDVCILSDYGKGVVTGRLASHLIKAARMARKPVIVDPKKNDYLSYRGADVIKPNLYEAELFLGREIQDESALLEAGNSLAAFLEGTTVVITRGPRGMSVFRKGAALSHFQAVTRNVFDVTGAGDTVIGALGLALSAGASIPTAIQVANLAAGIVVSKMGTATVSFQELMQAAG